MNRTALLLTLAAAPALAADQSPAVPDSVIDLRTTAGVSSIQGQWRYTDAHIITTDHKAPGPDLKATGSPVKTNDIHPRIHTPDFDNAPWQLIPPDSLESRRTNGRLAFAWYRLDFTIPERAGSFDTSGSTIILELVVDDYSEVWVNAQLPQTLGESAPLITGWNKPTRVTLATNAKPGEQLHLAIFAANGPLSDPPPNFVWIRSATLDFYKPQRALINTPTPVETTITRLDPALDDIISPGTQAEKLADGFVFTEGPVWVPTLPADSDKSYGGGGKGGYLLFSDPNKNVIHRYDPPTGEVSIFRTKSGYSGIGGPDIAEYHQPGSNGLALDPQGRLTICEHGNRRVTRLEPNGSLTILADNFQGKRLNSPNDLVYRSDGTLFFTDPPFGLPMVFDDPRKQLSHSGVYCLRNNSLKLVSKDLNAPNGLAFSPDEKTLYVDNWDENKKVVMAYDVAPDGTLSNPTTFFDMTSTKGEICLDGLKVDAHGNLFVSGPGGIWVLSPDAKHLGTIALPELPANFAFGDDDRRTLYCCARTGLYRIRLSSPGR